MNGSVALVVAGLGLWAVLGPLVLGLPAGSAVAGAVLPGLFAAAAGGYAGLGLARAQESEERDRLLVSLTSTSLLLGLWMLLSPFLLGIPLAPSTFLAILLPGAGIVALSLLNGYFGWREPPW